MTVSHRFNAVRIACLLLCSGLAACSSVEGMLSGDKVDYRSGGTTRKQNLDVPPDLSQLSRDNNPQQQQPDGSVSAAAVQAAVAVSSPTASVAPKDVGSIKLVREGNQRWLSVPMTPEQLWPQLQGFWKSVGFQLEIDQPQSGVIVTNWAEDRAKLPQDIIRRTIGRAFDSLYSTGLRDQFRTRVERTPTGSEIYLSHQGLEEIYSNERKDSTIWQPRAADPQLEAMMLEKMMLKLGASEEQAKQAVASPVVLPARARIVEGQPAAMLQVDDNFDRAWRRVGLALDRSGFTVEDRDRAQGIYFVRYIDPAQAGKDEPGFISRVFSFGKKDDLGHPVRYRVTVKAEGDHSNVSVLNAQGQPEKGDAGQRIVKLLVEDLK